MRTSQRVAQATRRFLNYIIAHTWTVSFPRSETVSYLILSSILCAVPQRQQSRWLQKCFLSNCRNPGHLQAEKKEEVQPVRIITFPTLPWCHCHPGAHFIVLCLSAFRCSSVMCSVIPLGICSHICKEVDGYSALIKARVGDSCSGRAGCLLAWHSSGRSECAPWVGKSVPRQPPILRRMEFCNKFSMHGNRGK